MRSIRGCAAVSNPVSPTRQKARVYGPFVGLGLLQGGSLGSNLGSNVPWDEPVRTRPLVSLGATQRRCAQVSAAETSCPALATSTLRDGTLGGVLSAAVPNMRLGST